MDNFNEKVVLYKFKSKDNYSIFAMYEKTNDQDWKDPFTCDAAILTYEAKSRYYNTKCIHIGDIRGHKTNRGLASILMKYLKSYCLTEGIIEITGDIFLTEYRELEQVRQFYKKHNFKVRLNDQTGNGNVRWVKWYDLKPKTNFKNSIP